MKFQIQFRVFLLVFFLQKFNKVIVYILNISEFKQLIV